MGYFFILAWTIDIDGSFSPGKITLTVVFASGFVSFVMHVLLQFLLLLFNGKCSILANPSDIEVLLYMKVTNYDGIVSMTFTSQD